MTRSISLQYLTRMETYKVTQQQLDDIVSDLLDAHISWDGNHGHIYVDKDYDDLHVAIGADFDGYSVDNIHELDGHYYYDTPDKEVSSVEDCELCECWLNSDDSVEVDIDLKYIDEKLQEYYN